MVPQTSAQQHTAVADPVSAPVVLWKQPYHRGYYTAQPRQTDHSAMQMSGQDQIRSPVCILRKILRIMSDHDLITVLIRFPQPPDYRFFAQWRLMKPLIVDR